MRFLRRLAPAVLLLCLCAETPATTITVTSFTFGGWSYGGTAAKLRLYASRDFTDSAGVPHVHGTPGATTGFFQEIGLTVSGANVTVPTFTTVSTLDALLPEERNVTITGVLFDSKGVRRETLFTNWAIPSSPSPTTWAALRALNSAKTLPNPPARYLDSDAVQALLAGKAQAGANADITSVSGLTTPLSVSQGGMGAATHTSGKLLAGNGTNALSEVTVGSGLNLSSGTLSATGGGGGTAAYPTFSALPANNPVTPGTIATVADEGRAYYDTGYLWTPVPEGALNAQWFNASGARTASAIGTTTTTTTANVAAGATTIPVLSGASFNNGDMIKVTGGGVGGAAARELITAGGGTNTLTVYPALNTAIGSGATIHHGDNIAFTTTTADASPGATSLQVGSSATFKAGQGIAVVGAGATSGGGKAYFVTTVAGVPDATHITLAAGITSAITANAIVMHDDTLALRAAVAAAVTLKGARVYVPSGTYMLNAPDVSGPSGYHGKLLIPSVGLNEETVTVEIVGDPQVQDYLASFSGHYITSAGTILQSDGAGGAIINGSGPVGGSDAFTEARLKMRDVMLRAYDDPQITGIGAAHIGGLMLEDVTVDTGSESSAITQPTNPNAHAIEMPQADNNNYTILNRVTVGGSWSVGYVFGEHANVDELLATANLVGYQFPACNYPIFIGTLLSNENTIPMQFTGRCKILGGLLKTEHRWSSSSFPAWTATTYDVSDPSNLARGVLFTHAWNPDPLATTHELTPAYNGAKYLNPFTLSSGINFNFGSAFTDKLQSPTLQTTRWAVGSLFTANDGANSGTITPGTSYLTLTPATSQAGTHYQGVVTRDTQSLEGRCVAAQVSQVTSNSAETALAIGTDPLNFYQIVYSGGNLIYARKGDGNSLTIGTVAYNATNHAWWRVCVNATTGIVTGATSPDGSTWTTLGTDPKYFDFFFARASVEVGTYQSEATPGSARVLNFSIQ